MNLNLFPALFTYVVWYGAVDLGGNAEEIVPDKFLKIPGGYTCQGKYVLDVHLKKYGEVRFALCGDTTCSAMTFRGLRRGVLGKRYASRCETNSPNLCHPPDQSYPSPNRWSSGLYKLIMVLSKTHLSVWPDGYPEKGITLGAFAGETELKIRTSLGSLTLENAPGGRLSDGIPIAVDQTVFALLNVTHQWSLRIGACVLESCHVMHVCGVLDGSMDFQTFTSTYNDPYSLPPPNKCSVHFSPNTAHMFIVHRISSSEYKVWLAADPDKKVLLQGEELKIRSDTGNVALFTKVSDKGDLAGCQG